MPSTVSSSSMRAAAVAGSFYPSSPKTLQREVDEFLERVELPRHSGKIYGLVSPHAGYMYSGLTAAHAYGPVKGKTFDAVIVVGPSHQEYFQGISIFPGAGYRTPLGNVPIHEDLRSRIAREDKGIMISSAGHRTEHSVEVQLPFLQRVLGSFSFVPVVMGDQTADLARNLADAIASAATGMNVLLAASSDLSHYHPYDDAVSLDRRVIDLVEAFDPIGLMDRLEHRQVEACGGGPIVAVMLAAKKLGAKTSHVVHYCNSGDVSGEKGAVVGYLSAIFTDESPNVPPKVN